MLRDGDKAPAFELPSDDGGTLRLGQFKGRPVVVFFYPKDNTPACTTEAKDFSDAMAEFRAAGADVLGISIGKPEAKAKFRKKHGLAMHLAADEENKVALAYGVWVEKSMYGHTFMGVERATFLIDGRGRIAKSWRKVRVAGHVAEVLAAVQALKS